MIPLSIRHSYILRALAQEPWLTADQLAVWLNLSPARTYVHLGSLLQRGFLQRVNSKSAHTELRGVYALTDHAVRTWAERRGIEERIFRARYRLTRARHTEILWHLERVCAVRDFLLRLPREQSHPKLATTLAQLAYVSHGKPKSILLHAVRHLRVDAGHGLAFAVEWDMAHLPLDRYRLRRLAEWLSGYSEVGSQRNVPILLFVASGQARLEQVWELLQARHQLPAWRLSAMYLTTTAHLALRNPQDAIWLSALRNRWERWAENESGRPLSECGFVLAANSSQARIGRFGKGSNKKGKQPGGEALLALKLELPGQAKRVLQTVAKRPFLTVAQVAWVSGENPDRVGKALKELAQNGLVEQFRHGATRRYRLTQWGMRYETVEAGYGRAVKQYQRACGGRSGLKRLGFHLEHTIAINDFFLRWLHLAREQNCGFEWVGEIESARFFRYGSRWHRFLPDGKGIWHPKKGTPFRFVLEMDRTRESAQNLRAKFKTYWMWRLWQQQQRGEPEPHVLVVTASWTQANVVIGAMEAAFGRLGTPYAMWLTTFEELEEHGLARARWQSNRVSGLHRLPCFVG